MGRVEETRRCSRDESWWLFPYCFVLNKNCVKSLRVEDVQSRSLSVGNLARNIIETVLPAHVEQAMQLHNQLTIVVDETVNELDSARAAVLAHVALGTTTCQHRAHGERIDAPRKNDCEAGPGISSRPVFTKFHLRHS